MGRFLAAIAVSSGCLFLSVAAIAAAPDLAALRVSPGAKIEVWADGVANARSMARSTRGTVFVGTRTGGGRVYAVRTRTDGSREVLTIASGLNTPNGVAYRKGALYVAEIDRILRYDDIDNRLQAPPSPVIVTTLPGERHHGWRYMAFGPDDKLYVAIGAPCNVCEPGDPYAAMLRMNADGTGRETFARGIRNSVGFDWSPVDGALWFTDNGRDMLGDDIPPDELNRAPRAGMHFGYPYCHGGEIADPEYGARRKCTEFEPPAQKLGPHVASLGMRFYTGTMFPADYRNQIFIAEHGSWNRSKKIGYRIALVRVKDGKAVAYESFASGWLQGESAWGRPADVLVLPDGSLLVADDHAGAIYRISYRKP